MKIILLLIMIFNNLLFGLTQDQRDEIRLAFNPSSVQKEIKSIVFFDTVEINSCSDLNYSYHLVIKTNIDPYKFSSVAITPIDLVFYKEDFTIKNNKIYLWVKEADLKKIYNNKYSNIIFYDFNNTKYVGQSAIFNKKSFKNALYECKRFISKEKREKRIDEITITIVFAVIGIILLAILIIVIILIKKRALKVVIKSKKSLQNISKNIKEYKINNIRIDESTREEIRKNGRNKVDEMLKLNILRKDGVLSEEEFYRLKKDLLG